MVLQQQDVFTRKQLWEKITTVFKVITIILRLEKRNREELKLFSLDFLPLIDLNSSVKNEKNTEKKLFSLYGGYTVS